MCARGGKNALAICVSEHTGRLALIHDKQYQALLACTKMRQTEQKLLRVAANDREAAHRIHLSTRQLKGQSDRLHPPQSHSSPAIQAHTHLRTLTTLLNKLEKASCRTRVGNYI